MHPLAPGSFAMLCALKFQADPVLSVRVTLGYKYLIDFLLVRLIQGVYCRRPIIKIEPMLPRLGQRLGQIVDYDSIPGRPMGRNAARTREAVWILTERVNRDEPAHAGPDGEGALPIRQGTVILINEWLQFPH